MRLSLSERLSSALPKGVDIYVHHLSALPTSTDPLFVPPLSTIPEPTELESHFLSASIRHDEQLVQVLGIEVLAYTTAKLTTLFVSKADSTGYLHLLNSPRPVASPIQTVVVEFLKFLVTEKQAEHSRTVISLFARAQDQYLFPGSIENGKKHVLDDRALIKWWAKIIERILKLSSGANDKHIGEARGFDSRVRANVVVPGCDKYETRGFIPRDNDYSPSALWQVGDPLQTLGQPADIPVRCLIPRFPDDPKARFAIDLDDELPTEPIDLTDDEQPIVRLSDKWRSVKSLNQFWELMSYRQECSAGRLVGFLWGIWEPLGLVDRPRQSRIGTTVGDIGPADPENLIEDPAPAVKERLPERVITDKGAASNHDSGNQTRAYDPKNTIPAALESSQTEMATTEANDPPPIDVVEPIGIPPLVKQIPSDITLKPDAYARCMEALLTLDYCDLRTAVNSTKLFLNTVAKEGDCESWGQRVAGKLAEIAPSTGGMAVPNNNLISVIRKRPKTEEANTLGIGLIRKKPKA